MEEIEAELLGGQKLQGTLTAKEVNHILKMKGLEHEFPFFTTVYKCAAARAHSPTSLAARTPPSRTRDSPVRTIASALALALSSHAHVGRRHRRSLHAPTRPTRHFATAGFRTRTRRSPRSRRHRTKGGTPRPTVCVRRQRCRGALLRSKGGQLQRI